MELYDILEIKSTASEVEIKKAYLRLIKQYHPDKVHDDEALKLAYETKSQEIIAAYHLLVSVAPETHALQLEEYTRIIANAVIDDYQYKGQTLKITFLDGSAYEYFGVPRNTYIKFINSPSQSRFARRHIYQSFTYRNVSKQMEAA